MAKNKLTMFSKSKHTMNSKALINAFIITFLSIYAPFVYTQDKAFDRKDITDTKKKLDINKEGLTDTQKKLDINKEDITDTKKLLRKTDSISNAQLSRLRSNALKAVGNEAYSHAFNTAPNLIKMRLKYDWLKIQIEEDYAYWKGREKREIESNKQRSNHVNKNKKDKKNNKKKGNEGLSETRAKDYEKRYSEYNKKIEAYESLIDGLDKKIIAMKRGVGNMSTEFAENTVGEDGVRLTDKYGNYLATLEKGVQVETKDSSLDARYYEVKFKNRICFALKEYFLK